MIPKDWAGRPAVVIASGPSLLPEDVDWCRGKAKVIVVSDNWRLAPWADVMYAADKKWWDHHAASIEFAGEKWTGMTDAASAHGLQYAHILTLKESEKTDEAFGFDPSGLHRGGGNSGFQAVNMALQRCATPVYLLGFDMQETGGRKHWFGNHPGKLNTKSDYSGWRKAMDAAASSLPDGVEIVNCTRETALTAYRRAMIQECLSAARSA